MNDPETDQPAEDSPADGAPEPRLDDERQDEERRAEERRTEERRAEATVAERLNRVTRYAAGGASPQAESDGKDTAQPTTSGANPHETLTVGRRIRLIAKLCECAELLVQGYLEATAHTKILRVAEGGCFIGTAEVEFADIRGHFEGNLTATKKLVIHPSGIVSGTARYQEIIIEAGGRIAGNSQSLAELPQTAGSGQAGQRQATSPKARQS